MGGWGIGPSCSIPTMVRLLLFKTPLTLIFSNRYPCYFVGRFTLPLPLFSPFRWWGGSTPPPPSFLPIRQGEVQHLPSPSFLPFCEGEVQHLPSRFTHRFVGGGSTPPPPSFLPIRRGEVSNFPLLHSCRFVGGEVQHFPPSSFLPSCEGEVQHLVLADSSGGGSTPPPPAFLLFCWRGRFNTSPHALLTILLGEVQHLPLLHSCRFVGGEVQHLPPPSFLPSYEGEVQHLSFPCSSRFVGLY
jgi:hypothetical protein